MSQFIHTCPYCGTQLSISQLPIEKTVSRCPKCNHYLVVYNYGKDVRKPNIYKCPKCGEEQIYDGRPQFVKCDKCNNIYVTSEYGVGMIDLALLSQGEKKELPYKKKRDKYVETINKWLSLKKSTKVGVFSAFAVILILFIGGYILSLPRAIEKTMAYAQMDSLWTEFSVRNPYNIQIECIKNYDDESRIVIISEPSDFVSENELVEFFEPYNSYIKTYKRKIGFDGWMRDFVVAFNDLNENNYESFVKDLSEILYKTDYKANIVDVSMMFEHIPYLDYDLNYNITSEELKEWFINNAEPIRPLEGKNESSTSITSVFESQIDGGMQLYASETPGFILWVIDNSSPIEELDFRINARKFSLDSDLILGAISKDNKVAIIARERCVPVTQLPPMRPETLCLLSYTMDDELSQSYERNNIFAGKQSSAESGGRDYAPILLSDALWHTEYGNILNVTDQMLKSWSENGLIDYIDFNYPKPIFWAFDNGVLRDLGVNTLTYNWNTDGVGYIVDDGQYSVYALNRTGSLPVSYIPGDASQTQEQDPVYQAEQNAYDFFSSLSNPELAKVVQYASMYQIFQNFDIHMRYKDIPIYDDYKFVMPEALKYEAAKMLKRIGKYNSSDKEKIAGFYNAKIVTDGTGLMIDDESSIVSKNKNVPRNETSIYLSSIFIEYLDSIDAVDLNKLLIAKDVLIQLDSLYNEVRPVVNDEIFINSLGEALIDRNKIVDIAYDPSSDNISNVINIDILAQLGVKEISKEDRVNNAFNAVFNNTDDIKKFTEIFSKYSHDQAKSMIVEKNSGKSRTWMKTPTIVESWSLVDSINSVGGHNLNSKVTRFRVSSDLKPGQTREITVGNKKIIEVSSVDSKTHITDQSYLRKVGRLDDATIKGGVVETRPRNMVAEVASKRISRGFNSEDHIIKIGKQTFTYADKEYDSLDNLINDFCKSSTENEVLNLHIECLDGSGVKPKMIINNINCRLRRGNTNLPMSKFDFSHATQTVQGDNVLFTIPIKSGTVDLGSTSSLNRTGLGGSSNIGARVNMYEGEFTFKIVNTSKKDKIISVLRQFFSDPIGYFNEYRLRTLFKRHGIELGVDIIDFSLDVKLNGVGIKEKEYLMIAKEELYKSSVYDIEFFKEEKVA